MHKPHINLLSVSFLCLITGCGGGSQGTGALSTGLGKKITLDTLTPEQQEQFCSAFKIYYTSQSGEPNRSCQLNAVFGEIEFGNPPSKETCEVQKQQCIQEFVPSEIEVPPFIEEEICQRLKTVQCKITVETAEKCLEKNLKMHLESDLRLTCDYADKFTSQQAIDFINEGFDESKIPECVEWDQKCPF